MTEMKYTHTKAEPLATDAALPPELPPVTSQSELSSNTSRSVSACDWSVLACVAAGIDEGWSEEV